MSGWPDRLRDLFANGAPDPAAEQAAAERDEGARALVRRLRETRAAAGLGLADVERDTRINRVYLEAIEAGRFEDLPAPIYARGFVRSYARYLGLDPEECVAAMPDLPPPLGLEPMPGLRRAVAPLLPAINLPVLAAVGAAAVLALAAFLVLPRLGGEPGIDLPTEGGSTSVATATGSPGSTPAAGATVPPFEDGATPDFTGVTRAEAERVLATLGVTPLFVEAADQAPAGTVFDQSPDPGTALEEGDVVTIFVSQGPP